MKVFVASVLMEDVDGNFCYAEVFDTIEKAKDYVKSELESIASDYEKGMAEINIYDGYGTMEAGDNYVTIEINEKEVK